MSSPQRNDWESVDRLRLYADDSANQLLQLSVLAGLVAPERQWAALEDEWRGLLQHFGIKLFKAKIAFNIRDPQRRADITTAFRTLLGKYISFGVSVAVHTDEFKGIFDHRSKKVDRNPYCFMHYRVIEKARLLVSPDVPIDFTFDEQPGSTAAKKLWVEFVRGAPVPYRGSLRTRPVFLDDESEIRLQAADLYAWREMAGLSGRLNGVRREMPYVLTDEMLFPTHRAHFRVPHLRSIYGRWARNR